MEYSFPGGIAMTDNLPTYIVLRSTKEEICGFVRFENQSDAPLLTVHSPGLTDAAPLRLLLLSCGEEGAVQDLGAVHPDAEGYITPLVTVAPDELPLWDAVALAEDWPSGRLRAVGWLWNARGAMWRLKEAAARYLAVPAE